MKYFRSEEDASARLPDNFMSGFLEVGLNMGFLGEMVEFEC